jgi:hypothetical protein
MRAILRANHQTRLCTISCQSWIAIEIRIDFFDTLFSNGCNGCMIEIKPPRNPTATLTQNRTRIRIQFGALKPKESKNDISPHSHYSRLYLILQTTRHSTHSHAASTIHLLGKCLCGQMSFWANVFLGKCLSGQMSFGQMSSGQMYFWANVFLGKCLLGKCLSGQMSFWANVFWANVHLGKCLSGQMSSGQMSSRQMSFWANVSGQMSLGKCRMGKCRITIFPRTVFPSITKFCGAM